MVTAEDGRFEFSDIPTGYEVFSANLPGYNEGAVAGDIGLGMINPEVVISLEKENSRPVSATGIFVPGNPSA